MNDIRPRLEGISESAACSVFGGSRDIQTDVFIAEGDTKTMARDVGCMPLSESHDSASPSRQRSVIISECRSRMIDIATRQAKSEGLQNSGRSQRVPRIQFNDIVIAYVASDDDTVHGRMHAVPLVGSFKRTGALRRCSRCYSQPSRRACVPHSDDVLAVDILNNSDAQCMISFPSSEVYRACTYRAARGGDQKRGLLTSGSPTTASHSDAPVRECQHTPAGESSMVHDGHLGSSV